MDESEKRDHGPGRSTRALGTALIALLWLVTLVVAAECAIRARWHHKLRSNSFVAVHDAQERQLVEAFDSSLWEQPWFAYKKNAQVRWRAGDLQFEVRTNSLGLRSREVSSPKRKDRFRILCIGGSTTVEGPVNEQTYPAILERLLNAWWGAQYFEVVNCGISGLHSGSILGHLEFYASLEPDLVIHYNAVNDVVWHLLPRHLGERPLLTRALLHSELIRTIFPGLQRGADGDIVRSLSGMTFDNYQAMVAYFRERGIPVALASFAVPDTRQLTPEESFYLDYNLRSAWRIEGGLFATYSHWIEVHNDLLASFCQSKGCIYLPVAEQIRGDMSDFVDICHMTDLGISRKAEIVASLLEDFLLRSPSIRRQ